MKVSVIIPMHGKNELTHACIEKVKENAGIDCDILVIDDSSEVSFSSASAQTIKTDTRKGFTGAVNYGLKHLRLSYDYVLLLNNDTLPQKDFLKHLVDYIEKNPNYGILSSGVLQNTDEFTLLMEGADLTTGAQQATHEDINEIRPSVFVPFCSVLISKKCIETVGLLDERLVNFSSDNDFCLRAVLMDFKVGCLTDSRVIHYQNQTVHSLKLDHEEDQRFFMYKWFGPLINEVLAVFPINDELKKYGKLQLMYAKQEELCAS